MTSDTTKVNPPSVNDQMLPLPLRQDLERFAEEHDRLIVEIDKHLSQLLSIFENWLLYELNLHVDNLFRFLDAHNIEHTQNAWSDTEARVGILKYKVQPDTTIDIKITAVIGHPLAEPAYRSTHSLSQKLKFVPKIQYDVVRVVDDEPSV